jgi:translation initiation factor 4G
MSDFGKIKSGGPSTFGPSSVFQSKKKAGEATPPLSRTSSSANMFGALANAEGAISAEAAGPSSGASSPSGAAADAGPQRTKLVLAPRSQPKEGEEVEGADEVESAAAEAAPATEVAGDFEGSSLTKADVERKIETDLKELWGEKGTGGTRRPEDIIEYFQYLPAGARPMLATKLVDEVYRLAKSADTQVVASGFELAVKQGLIDASVVKQR